MKAFIRHVDTCLCDYFQGSSDTVLAVTVDGNSTVKDVLDGIKEDEAGQDLGWSEEQYAAFNAALETLQVENVDRMDRIFNGKLEPQEENDSGPSVYAYFTVAFEDE